MKHDIHLFRKASANRLAIQPLVAPIDLNQASSAELSEFDDAARRLQTSEATVRQHYARILRPPG